MGVAVDVGMAGAKAGLAVLLLVAGAAKLAGLDGFAATVRLFVPAGLRRLRGLPRWVAMTIALTVALGEMALGGASLAAPAAGWLNPVVLAAGVGFVAVSGIGYARHRGRSCRCFGALSRRRFDRAGIARAAAIAAVAALPLAGLPASAVRLAPADRGLLLAAAFLLAAGAFTAARVLAASPDPVPWGAPSPGGASQTPPGQPHAGRRPAASSPAASSPAASSPAASSPAASSPAASSLAADSPAGNPAAGHVPARQNPEPGMVS
jgi:hypothetical protein